MFTLGKIWNSQVQHLNTPRNKVTMAPSCAAGEISLAVLSSYFHLPEKAVAAELGICLTSLKKIARSLGVTRWPYRKLRALSH